jgi:SAM-dependent methyltransferase
MNRPHEKPAEFDGFADDYSERIRHPIRNRFASSEQFFFERKIEVIRRFFQRSGLQTETLDWLDIGCGQGDILRSGRRYFKSVAGCDVSKEMLKSCQDLEVRQQPSAESVPFDNSTFDFVSVVCVYHHVPLAFRVRLTTEALRVLRPRGVLCIIEHNPLNPVTRLIVAGTPIDADGQLLRAAETGKLLSEAGGSVIQTQFFLLFPQLLHRLTRPLEDAMAAFPFGGQYAVFGRPRV